MLTLSATAPCSETRTSLQRGPAASAAMAAILAILGVSSIWPAARLLWSLWINDPLKSIGMLVPVVSLLLVLRAWRSLGWAQQGSWWGLALLVGTVAAVRFREQAVLMLMLTPRWNLYFPPLSSIAFAYVLGVVLLLGGVPLYRAARFPVWLMLLVNPVPHIFNVLVDLPLQRLSAHVARAFAHALHQPLTPDQMRLMFTPEFGMFIAPGCNGIRGAVTMGMIALVAGYLYRFRPFAHGLLVAGAVLLGYLFNFLRLCTLVLYYIVALHWTWLQDRAEMGDYVIGACLFLVGAVLLFIVLRRSARAGSAAAPEAIVRVGSLPAQERGAWQRLLAMSALVLLTGVHALVPSASASAATSAAAATEHAGPLRNIGSYHLTRTWTEAMPGGPVVFRWADYALAARNAAGLQPSPADAPRNAETTHVAVGVSSVLGSHESSICHSARGEDPTWTEEFVSRTADGTTEHFHASFFVSGARQWLELATLCNGDRCGEYSAGTRRVGFVYSRPSAVPAASAQSPDPIPVLLTVETADTSLPADVARENLVASMRDFLSQTRVPDLTRPYR